jgi:CHASE2 domain-containing sensor protein
LFSRVDNLLFDLGQKLHHQAAPTDIIVIGIDESSLSQLGRWPWSRQTHAALLNMLQKEGASVIGLDIVFSEPEPNDESHAGDKALATAIKQAGNVVLPVMLESTRLNGQVIETLPLSDYAENVADLGRVHAVLDEDGIARSIYLQEGIGAPVWQHFAQAILNVAQHQPSKNNFSQTNQADANTHFSLVRRDQRRISFLGTSSHFSTISYAQVLHGEFTKGLFKNKIVLVGATASGLGDTFPTSVSSAQQLMPGVEFHANVLQSIRTNTLIKTVLPSVSLLIMAIIAMMPLLWLPKLSALTGLITTLFVLVLVSFAAVLMPQLAGVWLPPSAALCSLLLAYPIWSWRKLESAKRYLDNELHQLKQSLMHAPAATNTHAVYDHFDARIEQVRAAGAQLRFLQEDKKETLAFISHDLRAPLARTLAVLEQHPQLKQQLAAPVAQALHLAEDFLQASRAEMLNSNDFKELDFASLAQQAVDEAYESATKKNIKLAREIVHSAVWVNGDFGLLQRAILNLILNAVKFSPENSTVIIQLSVENKLGVENMLANLSVTDNGPGIALEQQAKLFKRFSRTSSSATSEGAGLGLYFVHTVAEKHLGSVGLISELGKSTSFNFSLPIVSV